MWGENGPENTMKAQTQEPIAIRFGHIFWSLTNRLVKPVTKTTHFKKTLIVSRPPKDVYAFWRDFTNLVELSEHIASIETAGDDRHTRWVVNAPFGVQLSWNAEITADEVKRRIAWKTTAPADIPHNGQVIFHGIDDGKRTEVAIEIDYRTPFGMLGELIGSLLGRGSEALIADEIKRFQTALEATESVDDSEDESSDLLREARDIDTGGAVKHPEQIDARNEDVIEQPVVAQPHHAEPAQPKKKHKIAQANGKVVLDQRNNLRNHH